MCTYIYGRRVDKGSPEGQAGAREESPGIYTSQHDTTTATTKTTTATTLQLTVIRIMVPSAMIGIRPDRVNIAEPSYAQRRGGTVKVGVEAMHMRAGSTTQAGADTGGNDIVS